MTRDQALSFVGCHVEADGKSAKVVGVDAGGTRDRVPGVWLCLRQPGRHNRWYDATRDREGQQP